MTKAQLFTRLVNCKVQAKKHYDEYVLRKHIFIEPVQAAVQLQKHDELLAEAEICKLVLQSDY
jgi:hypothetical protein